MMWDFYNIEFDKKMDL